MQSLTIVSLILLLSSVLVFGYDIDADLARGLIGNISTNTKTIISNIRALSDYAEDCAGVYFMEVNLHNSQPNSGIYEIWPRQGILILFFVSQESIVQYCE